MVNRASLGQQVTDASLILDHTVHNSDISIPMQRISKGGYLWSNQVAAMINQHQHSDVMDIGCQLGQLYHSLSRTDWNGSYLGLDISEFYVDKARELFRENEKAQFALHSIEDSTMDKFSRHDVLVCSAVFEHTLNPRTALSNMIDATKQRLILRTMLGTHEMINTLKISTEYLCRQFSQQDLVNRLTEEGFDVDVIKDNATQSASYNVLNDIKGNPVIRQMYILDCNR